jgi:branched-chain amino acid transport system substrate-binding protein
VQALRSAGIEPEGYVLPAAAAAFIANQAVESAISDNKPLIGKFVGTTFQTVIGPVAFGENHELATNPYRLQEWRGTAFVQPDASTN